jgi:hypothetical protein
VRKKMLFISLVTSFSIAAQSSNLVLAANGIACLCENAAVGDAGTLTINNEQKICTKRSAAEHNVLMSADQLFSYRGVYTKSESKK